MEQEYSKPKMSKIFLDYASDFIDMGKTSNERRVYLAVAVLGWNLSMVSEGGREKQMQVALKRLEALNPGSKGKGIEIIRSNLEILLEKKLALFPEIHRLVVSAQLSIVDGKESLNVVSHDLHDDTR